MDLTREAGGPRLKVIRGGMGQVGPAPTCALDGAGSDRDRPVDWLRTRVLQPTVDVGEWVRASEGRLLTAEPSGARLLLGRVGVGDETSGSGCVLGGDQHAHSLSELPLGLEAAGVIRGGSGRDAMGLEHPHDELCLDH